PRDVIRERGADLLRLSMVLGNGPGQDLKLTAERMTGCQRLITKLWNASKLVDVSIGRILEASGGGEKTELGIPDRAEHPINRWMLARARELVARIDSRLEAYAFGDAAEQIRQAFWGEFCDFYLEAIKVEPLSRLRETAEVVAYVHSLFLKLFHPFMPFVTEHLWHELGYGSVSALAGGSRPVSGAEGGPVMLVCAAWPRIPEGHAYETEPVDAVERLVAAVRGIRAEQGLEPGAQIELGIRVEDHADAFEACRPIVARLVRAEKVELLGKGEELAAEGAAVAVDPAFQAAVRLGEADRRAEHERLRKQQAEAEKRLAGLEKQLANENFVTRAKPEAVENVRRNAEDCRATLATLAERLEAFE
ncbi:MAG: class I tRNA ligase family protein, partial [Holophagales bacterium]|nr:class I tRNA ligase family protein [Holophagales bacterium]